MNLFGKAHDIFDFNHCSVIQYCLAAHLTEDLMLIRYYYLEIQICRTVKDRYEVHLKAAV